MNPRHRNCGTCAWYEETNAILSQGTCIWLQSHPGMVQEVPFWMLPPQWGYPSGRPNITSHHGADCHQYRKHKEAKP